MVDIAEFLLARIDEDEAESALMGGLPYYDGGWSLEHEVHIRKECAAKRAILVEHLQLDPCDMDPRFSVTYRTGVASGANLPIPCPTFRALAAVYSDHPDYRQEWSL